MVFISLRFYASGCIMIVSVDFLGIQAALYIKSHMPWRDEKYNGTIL